jgi:preprotein translocase subunit SecB
MSSDTIHKENQGPVFNIQKVYIKDTSFETPHSPEIFKLEWKPDVHIDMQTKVAEIDKQYFEVVLTLTVTVKLEETVAFLAEVHQAGIFTIYGFEKEQRQHLLGSICPNILYPYGREAISALITKGGFPQLVLAPVNFDALYREHLQAQQQAAATVEEETVA